ncbi:MAG TPA: Holliday junction resolvase RuvX [Phycisphaerae bacterium]|nr:Holliday junction resolvase RuvX [Phycisphaerae bacterium]HNU45233.1 Holliday junction resolvase RuvX [Phycisphaerae bacterium]
MSRFLGIDYGTKRIGLAIGDTVGRLATPLATLEAPEPPDRQVEAVLTCAREYEVDAFVVGLPLNMDDTEGPQAQSVRRFGTALEAAGGLPVHYCDERLSSLTADELMQGTELTRKQKKRRRDRLAAQVMLQAFLDAAPSA